jgi:archaellum component FlaC
MADTRSLQQIKRETEQTRAGLTDTVEQLRLSVAETTSDIRQRISPEAIKAEVSGYIKSRGEALMDDITAAARRNPMQALAIGTSVAYPLLRMARAIPLPVLMIGAGLFFAGSKTGQAASQKAMDMASDLSDEVQRRANDVRDQVGEQAAAAKAYASDNLDRLRNRVSSETERVSQAADKVNEAASQAGATLASNADSLKEKAASLGASVADQASDLKDRTVRAAASAASGLQDIASGATSSARRAAGNAADAGLNAARTARDTASDLTGRTAKSFIETIEQNPLVVAGVGLLVGGLIASALPRSGIEDGLIGGASNSVKKRAQAAASQGLDAAKDVAGDVYDRAVRQAQAEGLNPDALDDAAQDLGRRVRRVAESAVTTAFEPQDLKQQDTLKQNTNGVRDHG